LTNLEWSQIDLITGTISLARLKNGIPSVHPLTGQELRALKRLRRDHPNSRHVFLSSRGTPMTRQNVNAFLADLGREAGFDFPLHPHLLRHATGYKLANDGRDTRSIQHYLGHRNIQSTVVYTHLNANRFNGWFRDYRDQNIFSSNKMTSQKGGQYCFLHETTHVRWSRGGTQFLSSLARIRA
jgi:type 1 fimbriae regulatory protein FimB/type 1 fimbriae regulatory protein FimE